MSFTLLVSPRAEKDLRKLERSAALRIDRALVSLTRNPYPRGIKNLRGSELAQFRIRVGDFRVLYDAYHEDKVVYIFRVGHRKDIYK